MLVVPTLTDCKYTLTASRRTSRSGAEAAGRRAPGPSRPPCAASPGVSPADSEAAHTARPDGRWPAARLQCVLFSIKLPSDLASCLNRLGGTAGGTDLPGVSGTDRRGPWAGREGEGRRVLCVCLNKRVLSGETRGCGVFFKWLLVHRVEYPTQDGSVHLPDARRWMWARPSDWAQAGPPVGGQPRCGPGAAGLGLPGSRGRSRCPWGRGQQGGGRI